MTTMEDQVVPEFALAMRGYDRLQVDDYVAQLKGWIAEAEARQTFAEDSLVDRESRMAALMSRVVELEGEQAAASPASILDEANQRVAIAIDSAVEAAQEIISDAESRAASVLDGARQQAARIVAASRSSVVELEDAAKDDRLDAAHTAEEIRSEATRDADTTLRRAREEADALVAAAEAQRDQVVASAEEHRITQQREIDHLREEHSRVLAQLADLRGALEGLISGPVAVLAAVDRIANEERG
jgi:cell division septum initiation protein DivIVA